MTQTTPSAPVAHQRLLAALPPADTYRWVAARKAAVARAVAEGALSRAEAQQRWNLSDEELDGWIARLTNAGEVALRATRIRDFAAQPRAQSSP